MAGGTCPRQKDDLLSVWQPVGLDVETAPAPPADLEDAWDRHAWFDTTKVGKGAAGHRFPDALSEDEKRAVLEYLKTL